MTQPSQRPWGLTLITILAAGAIGGGVAWFFGQSNSTKPPIAETTATPVPSNPVDIPTLDATSKETTSPTAEIQVKTQTYWLQSQTNDSRLIAKVIQPATPVTNEAQALETAFTQLLSGSDDPALATTIPKGTILLSLALKSDGIHIDLSKEFTSGGGAESMKGRLGQVLYTATSLKTDASVWISVEGKPLDVLGGEGLVVDQPLTRKVFEKEYL